MAERTYGARYAEVDNVKDAAKVVRKELRQAQRDGILPADWKVSVRYGRASMFQSINVRFTSPRPIYAADPMHIGPATHAETGELVHAAVDKLTLEARFAHTIAEDVLAAFNWDGTDYGTDTYDVRFYTDVTIGTTPGVPIYAPAA